MHTVVRFSGHFMELTMFSLTESPCTCGTLFQAAEANGATTILYLSLTFPFSPFALIFSFRVVQKLSNKMTATSEEPKPTASALAMSFPVAIHPKRKLCRVSHQVRTPNDMMQSFPFSFLLLGHPRIPK